MSKKSSASIYRALRAKQRAAEQTFDVESPSGMVWKLRNVDLKTYVTSGVLPLSMIKKSESLKSSGKTESEIFLSLSDDEQIKMLEFSARVVRDICVDPRIVDKPEADNEISPDEVLIDDFNFLVNWGMTNFGGEQAAGLENFRK